MTIGEIIMTQKLNNTTAPLQNVSLCVEALDKAVNRPEHLPGLVCFHGPSGFGKSTAAVYVANKMRAYCVQANESWKKKAFLEAILNEMGITPEKVISKMVDQICEQLALSNRPLIIDEMDFIVENNLVEIVRALYEGSGAAILLIGEEALPIKLSKWERFHGRILDWIPAQPVDMDDALHLRDLYCKDADVDDGLVELIHSQAKGSVRRVCINLERVSSEARKEGQETANVSWWANRPLYVGKAPIRKL